MIERFKSANFTQTVTGAQNFTINLGTEGSFKLIRMMTINSSGAGGTVVWGPTPNADGSSIIQVGINAPGVATLVANETYLVIDNESMFGIENAYLGFSVNQTSGDVLGINISYYDFDGFTNPATDIVYGFINAGGNEGINWGTSPKLEIIKSLWISPVLGQTVEGGMFIQTSGPTNVPFLGIPSTTTCLNLLPASTGMWLNGDTLALVLNNSSGSTGNMYYYMTGIGRP